jgi:hypothetical protein
MKHMNNRYKQHINLEILKIVILVKWIINNLYQMLTLWLVRKKYFNNKIIIFIKKKMNLIIMNKLYKRI